MSRAFAALLAVTVAVLLALAGCVAPVEPPKADGADDEWPADPPEDRLGWEAGYWHNESIAVDRSDGLNGSEREALVARTMARVEVIRGLEFEEPVEVEVISREAYRERRGDPGTAAGSAAYHAWLNQVWKSLLLVGDDRNVTRVFDETYGDSVLGYYSPGSGNVVIVSDSETPTIDRTTLAHELVHALQDQHLRLGGGPTHDRRLARQGLSEGDARYVEELYEGHCDEEWDCVPRPDRNRTRGELSDEAFGVLIAVYQPYSDGPHLVHTVRERGGWTAVNAMYDEPPVSTAQVIHPSKYPDERPVEVAIEDRSGPEWSRFDLDREYETLGEASLFAAFYANGYVRDEGLLNPTEPYAEFNYSHPATAGWAGDRVVPYRNGDGEYGYVLRTAWTSESDAAEFDRAYRTLLLSFVGGKIRAAAGPGTVVTVSGDDPYGGAYRVERDGATVTVVHAPSVEELDAVHPPD